MASSQRRRPKLRLPRFNRFLLGSASVRSTPRTMCLQVGSRQEEIPQPVEDTRCREHGLWRAVRTGGLPRQRASGHSGGHANRSPADPPCHRCKAERKTARPLRDPAARRAVVRRSDPLRGNGRPEIGSHRVPRRLWRACRLKSSWANPSEAPTPEPFRDRPRRVIRDTSRATPERGPSGHQARPGSPVGELVLAAPSLSGRSRGPHGAEVSAKLPRKTMCQQHQPSSTGPLYGSANFAEAPPTSGPHLTELVQIQA